jgi:hypothetical protein
MSAASFVPVHATAPSTEALRPFSPSSTSRWFPAAPPSAGGRFPSAPSTMAAQTPWIPPRPMHPADSDPSQWYELLIQ